MKTIKIIFSLVIVLLVSVFTISCNPDSPGVIPTTSGVFDVNLTEIVNASIDTTIVADGDSILFIQRSYISLGLSLESSLFIFSNKPGYEYLSVEEYPYNINTDMRDSTGTQDNSNINVLDAGVLINSAYHAHSWIPFTQGTNGFGTPFGDNYGYTSVMYNFSWDGAIWLYDGLSFNKDQYIVFRKLKGTAYQYYWVKVRNEGTSQMNSTIKIFNGKYQPDSIITGQ